MSDLPHIEVGQQPAEIDYTNYAGKRERRRITPLTIYWGSNEWHPEPQWLLAAYCHERYAVRVFALKSIHSWDKPDA